MLPCRRHGAIPRQRDYLELLACSNALMREMRSKARNEVEAHLSTTECVGNLPEPSGRAQAAVAGSLCLRLLPPDRHRNVRTYEIEALMDEEIRPSRPRSSSPITR